MNTNNRYVIVLLCANFGSGVDSRGGGSDNRIHVTMCSVQGVLYIMIDIRERYMCATILCIVGLSSSKRRLPGVQV